MTDREWRTFVYGGVFDSAEDASAAIEATRDLEREGRVRLIEAAAFERRDDGAVRFTRALSSYMDLGAKIGAIGDATIGLLVMGPAGALLGVFTGVYGGLLFGSLAGNLRTSTIAPLGARLAPGAGGAFVVASVETGVRSDMLLPHASCRERREVDEPSDIRGQIAGLADTVMASVDCE